MKKFFRLQQRWLRSEGNLVDILSFTVGYQLGVYWYWKLTATTTRTTRKSCAHQRAAEKVGEQGDQKILSIAVAMVNLVGTSCFAATTTRTARKSSGNTRMDRSIRLLVPAIAGVLDQKKCAQNSGFLSSQVLCLIPRGHQLLPFDMRRNIFQKNYSMHFQSFLEVDHQRRTLKKYINSLMLTGLSTACDGTRPARVQVADADMMARGRADGTAGGWTVRGKREGSGMRGRRCG